MPLDKALASPDNKNPATVKAAGQGTLGTEADFAGKCALLTALEHFGSN
jgi:hypothetical protein